MFVFICYLIGKITGYKDVGVYVPEGDMVIANGYVRDIQYKNEKWIIHLNDIKVHKDEELVDGLTNCGMLVYLKEGEGLPHIGQYVSYKGEIANFNKATNPGEFDMRQYYASLNINVCMYKSQLVGASTEYSIIMDSLYEFKGTLSNIYDLIFNETDASIIKAMVLGNKAGLDKDIKELYQKSGISHILAISGLHISIIGMFIFLCLKAASLPAYIRVPISLLVMLIYGLMTGMSISTMRALIMFSLMLSSFLILRTYDILTALGLSMVITIFFNPDAFYNAGFYLSYMAVLGIAVFSKSLSVSIEDHRRLTNMINRVISGVAVSIFTLPLILTYYYEYPLYSILLNMAVLPLMGVLLGFAICAGLIGLIWIDVAYYIAIPCKGILGIYEWLCVLVMRLPGSTIVIGKPAYWQIIIFYLICFAIYSIFYFRKYFYIDGRLNDVSVRLEAGILKKILLKYRKTLSLKKIRILIDLSKYILIIAAILVVIPIHKGLDITVLDVGQGDGICIRYGSNTYMIDCGSSNNSGLYDYQLLPCIKSYGINRIDYWLVSHPDNDHISGLLSMLESEDWIPDIGAIVLPDVAGIKEEAIEIIDGAGRRGIPVIYIKRGDEIANGTLSLLCISPPEDMKSDDVNSCSEVFLLSYGDFSMLFTGDSTVESEKEYLEYLEGLGYFAGASRYGYDANTGENEDDLDILKAAHHGSNTSNSELLFDALRPANVIISAGRSNRYGHPHEEVVRRIIDSGANMYSTQNLGAILISVNERGYKIDNY